MRYSSLTGRTASVLLLSFGCTLLAQESTRSSVSGVVVDPSGSVLPHAKVQVTGSGGEQAVESDAVGRFSLRLLPGTYQLEVLAAGFQPLTQSNLTVTASQPTVLRLRLQVETAKVEIDVPSEAGLSNDADANKSALIFKGEQLDTFANDPVVMQQQLQVLAGSSPGDTPQLYVDGFSNGKMPAKESIREVRINQNPFTAASSEFGRGRIDLFTKPGSNTFHGGFEYNYGNRTLNARNPYTGPQPNYNNDYIVASFDGPIGKKTSFFLYGQRSDLSRNEVVNAVVLDGNLNVQTISQPVKNQAVSQAASGRIDRQLGSNDTFIGRYTFEDDVQPAAGVGLLVLPSQAYSSALHNQTVQVSDTHIFGPRLLLDAALQYQRTQVRQDPASTAVALTVQGSFSGGGSPMQALHDNADNLELQQQLTFQKGNHLLRAGLRFRLKREANLSTAGYNGQFIFPDITTYRNTLLDLQNGYTPTAIRAKGDGPTQFSLSAGTPSVSLVTSDLGVYGEDEWKIKPEFSLTYGLRLESQTSIPDHFDIGPRAGFAYSIRFHKNAKNPVVVFRGGFGFFYKRFVASDILNSIRQNGVTEQVYFISSPYFYPNVPSPASLGSAVPSSVYRISPRLHTPVQMQGLFSVERGFGKFGSVAASYYPRRQFHEFESLNLNAPLPGSGLRPLDGLQNIYQYSSDGISRGQDLNLNSNVNVAPWLQAWATVSIDHDQTDVNGADSFPSNSYNIGVDRSNYNGFSSRKVFAGVNAHGHGFAFNLFFGARSAANFDITTGSDNNGDSIYNDRPAFATDLTRASVMRTAFGNFDLSPLPGQTIIPRNYGKAPDFKTLELYANKEFYFGPRPAAPPASSGGAALKGGSPSATRPYRFQVGISVDNLLNINNAGPPIGVLTSPLFGKSISLNAPFTNNTAANRSLTLRGALYF